MYVADLDFKSIYPTLTRVLNVSRGTMKRAVYAIEGMEFDNIQRYFSNLINVKENCVNLCNEYFNMPSYIEMEKIFKKEIIGEKDE